MVRGVRVFFFLELKHGVTFRIFLSYFVFPFKIKTKISGDSKPFSNNGFFKNKTSLAFLSGKRIIAKNTGSTK